MQKILFLPLLQIPTGHHQVADALIQSLQKRIPEICLKKVDFLSYVNPRLEKMITKVYLRWISHLPKIYNWTYRRFVYPLSSLSFLQWYEDLFLTEMQEMLAKESPDLIICTQAYPSYLISKLKELDKVRTPVINVYTDFFINRIWGLNGIDYHFVPDAPLKQELIDVHRIPENRIFITGIPVDESFIPNAKYQNASPPYHLLISGGNAGLGDILGLLRKIRRFPEFQYSILCGNNKQLFKEINSWGISNIRPLSYMSSKKELNDLYDRVDAIITKPGGVTISEALTKKLPIFIHSALPGQEEINREYLLAHNLVYELKPGYLFNEQLLNLLNNQTKQNYRRTQVDFYCQRLETKAWEKILELIEKREMAVRR